MNIDIQCYGPRTSTYHNCREHRPHTRALALLLCSSCPSGTVAAFFRRRPTGYIISNYNILQYKGRSFITALITGGM